MDALETIDELCENLPVGARIPHPEDCNLYLKCTSDNDESFALVISCQNNVFFNPSTLECDPDYENEICKKPKTTTTIKKTTTTKKIKPTSIRTKSTTQKTKRTKRTTTTIKTTIDDNDNDNTPTTRTTSTSTSTTNNGQGIVCPEIDNDQVKFIESQNDCAKFFMCYHGRALPLKCWNGLHYSPKYMTCTPPEIAKCTANTTPYPNCPIFGRALLPHPDECRYFFYCSNGIKTLQQCGTFDYWDIVDKKCKRKTSAVCYSENKNENENDNDE